MKKIERVSLIGLGAIGCAHGRKIEDAMPGTLKVIADQERINRYKKDGFYINTKKYNFDYMTPEEDCPPDDLILISVKYNGLKSAIHSIRKHVGPNTIILSLLNGISSEEKVGEVYGMDKLLYSLCINIDAVKVENKITFSTAGRINFGEKTNVTYSENVLAVKDFFERVDIGFEIPEDMMHSLWWKFMINTGINQASAIMKANYGVFQKIPEARGLMNKIMDEVILISEKEGYPLTSKDVDAWYAILDVVSSENKTSMLQDMEAGRKTEVDIFAGTIIELGKKHNIATPFNEAIYYLIKTMEKIHR